VRLLQSDRWRIAEFTQCSQCKQHETENSSVCSWMKQSNPRVSSRSAADSKHGVWQPIFRLVLGTTKSQLIDKRSDVMKVRSKLISWLLLRTGVKEILYLEWTNNRDTEHVTLVSASDRNILRSLTTGTATVECEYSNRTEWQTNSKLNIRPITTGKLTTHLLFAIQQTPGASWVKERSCRNALDQSHHLQEFSRSFSNSFDPTVLS